MPTLQITDVVPRVQYNALGGQTAYTVPFVFFVPTDLAVYVTPSGATPNDFLQILTYNTQYTVTQNTNFTGTVTLNTPSNTNDTVTIVRAQPDQRLNYYLQGAQFTADEVNTDFEQDVLMIQQNKMYDINVGVHYNLSANPLLPNINGTQDTILPVLQANEIWIKDPTNNFITTTTVTQVGSTIALSFTITITQPNHGFNVGDVVYFNGVIYVLAMADTVGDAEVIGIVTGVINTNTFQLTFGGLITALTGLTPGGVYFLSDVTPGLLTLTPPSTIGHIEKPLLIAVSSTNGYFYNWRGKVIPAPGGFSSWTRIGASQAFTPNMGFITTSGALVTLTLPATANVGDTFRVTALGVGGWSIAQNAGQLCSLGTLDSTLGVGGSMSSTQIGDSIELVCVQANEIFQAVSSVGNIAIV